MPDFPQLSDKRLAIRVSNSAESAIRSHHPWLFDQGIESISGEGRPGDLAVIFDKKRRFLAIGLYDPDSPIRVKILQHRTPAQINGDWFSQRCADAVAHRAILGKQNTNGYRVINGENDHFPGLILDKYADTLVLKLYTRAWFPHLRDIIPAIVTQLNPANIVLRLSRRVAAQALPKGVHDGAMLIGNAPKNRVVFQENEITFEADVFKGQKTGFFLDQRDNRAKVGSLARRADVLDVFSCTGGFSVYCAKNKARSITAIDISEGAMSSAESNLRHNRIHTPFHPIVADAFKTLTQLAQSNRKYDLIILDPPAYAQKQADIKSALNGYTKLTRLGLKLLAPNGTLVQASCSSRIKADTFFDHIHQTARAANQPLRELARTQHALDHPVTFPEGAYLKCLYAK